MKKMETKKLFVYLLILVVSVITGNYKVQAAESKLTIKIAEVNAWLPENTYCYGVDWLGKRIEKLAGGKVEVKCYYGTLGSETNMTEDLKVGTLDIIVTSTATLSAFVKQAGLLNLPCIFKGENADIRFENAWKVLDGPFGEWIVEKALKEGIRIAGWWRFGGFSLFTNVPIQKLEDLKGRKIRTLASREQLELYKAYGAIPVSISWKEVYTALQTGVVDGCVSNIGACWAEHIHEVIKYHTEVDQHLLLVPIMISERKWKTYPEDLQKAILQASRDSIGVVRKQDSKYQKDTKQNFIKYGVKVFELTPEEQKKFEDIARNTVWQQLIRGEEEKIWFEKLRKTQE